MEKCSFIRKILSSLAVANEDAIAVSLFDGQLLTDISYNEFLCDILTISGYFVEQNIRKQHIALVAPNSYELLVVFFGVLASGNVAVMLNPALPSRILQHQCEQADVSILWNGMSEDSELRTAIGGVQWLSFDEMKTAEPIQLDDIYSVDSDETIILLATSGTTGKSKIVEITSRNLSGSLDNLANVSSTSDIERAFFVMPLYHIGGIVYSAFVLERAKTLCIGRGMPYFLSDMPMLCPTYVALVPAMLESIEKILKHTATQEERAKYLGDRLQRMCVAGASAKSSSCRYSMRQGFVVETGYGMTETTGDGTWCELDEEHMDSIGKPRGSIQCRIQDGEILFKGSSVMKGYYKNPEDTAKIIQDGWIHTGDTGYCDADGYYYLTGRKKNVIILSNGENVNPEEIEAKFGECEAILECMVYSDRKGICADVYTENEKTATDFIREYNEQMPMYRQVYKVNFYTTPLEKTGSGKIKRKENIYV